uniref:Small ribosomal subunit protein uS3c n=1 Tax=Pedobesia claviformis TaxID=2364088 RepID=A0A386B0S0_9CHLO|nr:ribosomal protein S3 [Pedobesia claviformis]AYC65296.1 ribosomal protein S3 [Pedobesia claviformis]
MGQKIHPYGFRLGPYTKHHQIWFGNKNTYSAQLYEDLYIRKFFKIYCARTGILSLHISRQINNHVSVIIFCSKPNFFITSTTKNLYFLRDQLEENLALYQKSFLVDLYFRGQFNQYNQPMKVSLHLRELKKYERNATFLSNFLVDQLEKRISFRKAIKKTLLRIKKIGVDGIKIQISGRLNGAEIARTEWFREGRVPLHTLKANINYCQQVAQTIYGILGIKIWVFMQKKEE